MSSRVDWYRVIEVSKKISAFIFRVKRSKKRRQHRAKLRGSQTKKKRGKQTENINQGGSHACLDGAASYFRI
jgi:hypothetical protein